MKRPALRHVPEGTRLFVPGETFGAIGRDMPEGVTIVDAWQRIVFLDRETVRAWLATLLKMAGDK